LQTFCQPIGLLRFANANYLPTVIFGGMAGKDVTLLQKT
jgi:hypothetical protein